MCVLFFATVFIGVGTGGGGTGSPNIVEGGLSRSQFMAGVAFVV